jgi:hypothetical protein
MERMFPPAPLQCLLSVIQSGDEPVVPFLIITHHLGLNAKKKHKDTQCCLFQSKLKV